jgi:CheY-like chemotaxis protein
LAGRKTVLVVDDELSMRIFIATLLETSGYAPVLCKDGREGIRKARELRPDLIILDVMMPGEGGVRMYRTLKTEPAMRNIPVLMLSGVEEKSFSHFLGMLRSHIETPIPDPDAYLEKPPEPGRLQATVDRLLGAGKPEGA